MTKSTKVELIAKAKLVAKPIAKPACKGGKPFPCKDCPKSYESIASRAKHWNNNHAQDCSPPPRGRPPMPLRTITLKMQGANLGMKRTRDFTEYKQSHLDTVGEVWEGSPSSVAMKYQGDNYDNVLTDSGKAYAGACVMTERLTKAVNQHLIGGNVTNFNNVVFNSPANVDMRSQSDLPGTSSINGGTMGRMSSGSVRMSSGSLHDLPSRDSREHGPTPVSGCFTFGQPISGKKGPTFGNGKRMVDLPAVQKTLTDNARMKNLADVTRNLLARFEELALQK